MPQDTLVIGVFTSGRQAGKAVHELRRAGFRGGQIQVVKREKRGATESGKARVKRGTRTVEAPAAAAVRQALEFGEAARPPLAADPSPTAGTVVSGLLDGVRQAAAAAAEALASTLVGMGLLEDEADFYERAFRAGRTLVAVRVRRRREEAAAVLRRCGAYDARDPRPAKGIGKSPAPSPGAVGTLRETRPSPQPAG